MAHIMKNTDKDYPCIQCGSSATNIVRESPDPRLKCGQCGMMFDASQSTAAKEAGAIPDGPPEIPQEPRVEQPVRDIPGSNKSVHENNQRGPSPSGKIPRSPSFVLVSKDRTKQEFATQKDIKRVVLRWQYEDIKFDLFELQSKSVSAKVDIT